MPTKKRMETHGSNGKIYKTKTPLPTPEAKAQYRTL